MMGKESESLRAALHAAAHATHRAVQEVDGDNGFEFKAKNDLELAEMTVLRLLKALEDGKWPGRKIAAMPAPGEYRSGRR